MLVSRRAVAPLAVEPIDDVFRWLEEAHVELRVRDTFAPLRGVWDTTLHASGIRLANAKEWDHAPSPAPESIRRLPS